MRLNSLWISRKKYVLAPLVLLVLLLAIAACGSDSSITQSDAAMEAERMEAEAMAMEEEKKEAEAMAMEEEKMEAGISLQLDLSGVDPLANGYHYEGWAIIGGDPVSTASSISGPTAPSSGWMERSKRMEFSIRYRDGNGNRRCDHHRAGRRCG